MRREISEKSNQIMALTLEVQRLKGQSGLDRQTIEDLDRRCEQYEAQIKQMMIEDTKSFQEFKQSIAGELNNLKIAFEKIGKELQCLDCKRISTDCLMLKCGHTFCSDCSLRRSSKCDMYRCEDCSIESLIKTIARSMALKNVALSYLMSKKVIESLVI